MKGALGRGAATSGEKCGLGLVAASTLQVVDRLFGIPLCGVLSGLNRLMRLTGLAGDPVGRPGKILFEMEGVSAADAAEAMRLASHKLPLRTKFVSRDGVA